MMMNILIQNQNSTSHVTAIITGHILILVIHRTISVHEKIHSSELVIASSSVLKHLNSISGLFGLREKTAALPSELLGPLNSEQSIYVYPDNVTIDEKFS